MFIKNFAKNIEWPPDSQQGDFIIGVFDNQKVAKDMQSFFIGKSINGRKVVIRNFPNINSIQDPHILFIPISNKNVISGITNKLGNKPILIITEKEGWGKQGSVINFIVTEEGRMKFELNKDAAQKRSIKIPSSLANLAIIL